MRNMMMHKLEGSPVVYYISKCATDEEDKDTEAEWILFIHAAFADHRMFREQIEFFRDRYNILTLDIIGHGKSTDTKKGDSIDKMSGWIHDILQAEKIAKVHIVGISLGAILAQDFANRYPEALHSLACFGGYDINNFDAGLQRKNSGSQARMMLKALVSIRWFAKSNRKISAHTEKAQNDFYAMNTEFPKRSFMYLASLGSLVNKYRPAPRRYALMIGCGEYTDKMEKTAVEMWRQSEMRCRAVIFEGAGHCVNMDVPQHFNAVMDEFWASCTSETAE